MPYKIVENVAIADACYDLSGSTLEELFESGFKALMETMVDLNTVKTTIKEEIVISSSSDEKLLFEFLEELVFRKDAESMIYKSCELKINIDPKTQKYQLFAIVDGQEINDSVATIIDVKAITYYQFYIAKKENEWKARVTFDL